MRQCDPCCSMTTRFECVTDRLNRLESVEPHRLNALTEQPFVYSRGRKFIITASLEATGGNEEEKEELIIFWKGARDVRYTRSCNLFGTALQWNSSVRLWSTASRKKYVGAPARGNQIMESSCRFFPCKETRYPSNASCCVLSYDPCSVLLDNPKHADSSTETTVIFYRRIFAFRLIFHLSLKILKVKENKN